MQSEHYSRYSDPVIRDLAWLLDRDHDLPVRLPPFTRFQPVSPALAAVDPAALSKHKTVYFPRIFSKLGLYFEDLVEVYLRALCTSGEVVERNLQIFDDTSKITLGELDFVYENNSLTHHLEVSVKFYAAHTSGGPEQWLGENPCDTLSGKLAHLQTRQLPRSSSMPRITGQRSYWLKGRLFRSLLNPADTALPVSGTWCYRDQLPLAAGQHQQCYAALPYQRWLGGLGLEESRRLARPLSDWSRDLVALERSVMLSSVEADRADRWRIWVMPDHWPGVG